MNCGAVPGQSLLGDSSIPGTRPPTPPRGRTLLNLSSGMAAALPQAVRGSHDLGVLLRPPRRVNLASKSRSGALLGSLSDLLKGLALGSRNADRPAGPNLTSAIAPAQARAFSKLTITREAAGGGRHRLFITHSPSGENQIPPVTARC